MAGSDGEVMTSAEDYFVANMKAAREANGWSQSELAKRLQEAGAANMHQTTVSRIEKGERPVRVDEAVAIAEALGRNLSAFVVPPAAFGLAERLIGESQKAADTAKALEISAKVLCAHMEALAAAAQAAREAMTAPDEGAVIALSLRLAQQHLRSTKGELWRRIVRERGLADFLEEADALVGDNLAEGRPETDSVLGVKVRKPKEPKEPTGWAAVEGDD